MKQLYALSVHQILTTYELPHRFLCYFTSQCAKNAIGNKNIDPGLIKVVDIAERFGNGEDFTQEYLIEIRDDLTKSRYYSLEFPHIVYAISYIIQPILYNTTATQCAYSAAYNCAYSIDLYSKKDIRITTFNSSNYADLYKPLLLELINNRLTELDKVLIFG